MKPKTNVIELLLNELKHCYHSEKRQLKAYPKLIKKAKKDSVKRVVEINIRRKEQNVNYLEKIFKTLDQDPFATEVLYQSTKDMIEEIFHLLKTIDAELSDPIIVTHIRQINKHNRERYNTALSYANQIELYEIAEIIHCILVNQKCTESYHHTIENKTLKKQVKS